MTADTVQMLDNSALQRQITKLGSEIDSLRREMNERDRNARLELQRREHAAYMERQQKEHIKRLQEEERDHRWFIIFISAMICIIVFCAGLFIGDGLGAKRERAHAAAAAAAPTTPTGR